MHDMLSEACVLGCKAINTPMKANAKLQPHQGEILDDLDRYRQLVDNLNYLIILDITFVESVVSQFLFVPMITYWDAVV